MITAELLKRPNNMIPQVIKRRIGKVDIIDLNGSITGLWVTRLRSQLERACHNLDGNPAVLNFRHITDIDSLGTKSVCEAVSNLRHLSVLSGSSQVMDFFNRYPESKRFQIFNDERDLVLLYGADLLENSAKGLEHRGSFRLQTAIAVKFSYDLESGRKQCVGVVSNLNEHGFYIEYIDILSVEQSLTDLSPYDIQILDFILTLPNGKVVSGQGKVQHWQLNQDQFGIGVHIEKIESEDAKRFSDFLHTQKDVINHNQKGR